MRKMLILVMLFGVLMFTLILPTAAAADATITNITVDGCYMVVTFVVEDGGFYAVNVWDDGSFRAGAGGYVGTGQTGSARIAIGGVILQGASGIGIYVENGVGLAATTTFDSNGSFNGYDDTTGTTCAATHTWGEATFTGTAAACSNPLPSGSTIYSVPGGAPAFWGPDLSTQVNFSLSAGSWYISEFRNDFAKVWVACEASPVWIPANTVSR